jgi:hypothetical protein
MLSLCLTHNRHLNLNLLRATEMMIKIKSRIRIETGLARLSQ